MNWKPRSFLSYDHISTISVVVVAPNKFAQESRKCDNSHVVECANLSSHITFNIHWTMSIIFVLPFFFFSRSAFVRVFSCCFFVGFVAIHSIHMCGVHYVGTETHSDNKKLAHQKSNEHWSQFRQINNIFWCFSPSLHSRQNRIYRIFKLRNTVIFLHGNIFVRCILHINIDIPCIAQWPYLLLINRNVNRGA